MYRSMSSLAMLISLKLFKLPYLIQVILAPLKHGMLYGSVSSNFISYIIIFIAGSSLWEIDVAAPILRCRKLGYNDTQIVIDVILNTN